MTAPATPEELHALITEHLEKSPTEALHVFGLSEKLYRDYPAVNVSSLKPLAESAKKYRWEQDHPKKRTKAMDFGTIVHGLTLTPEEVPGLWVKKAYPDFKTKIAQQWRDAQTLIILDDEDLAEMTAAAEAIKAEPKAAWILARAQKEVAVFKRHERTRMLLKARIDLPFPDINDCIAVADIKKVQSVKPSRLAKDVGERLIHAQLAFYASLIGASSGYIIAVEEAAPNEVRVFKLTDAAMQRGTAIFENWLTILAKCTADNRWPGVDEDSESVAEIEEPRWAQELAETI